MPDHRRQDRWTRQSPRAAVAPGRQAPWEAQQVKHKGEITGKALSGAAIGIGATGALGVLVTNFVMFQVMPSSSEAV